MRLILEVLTFCLVLCSFCYFVIQPAEQKRKEDNLKCRVIHVDNAKKVLLVDGPVINTALADIPSRVCFYCEDQKVHCRDDEQF